MKYFIIQTFNEWEKSIWAETTEESSSFQRANFFICLVILMKSTGDLHIYYSSSSAKPKRLYKQSWRVWKKRTWKLWRYRDCALIVFYLLTCLSNVCVYNVLYSRIFQVLNPQKSSLESISRFLAFMSNRYHYT